MRRRRHPKTHDILEAYRKVRKPMPPAERIEEDRRRKLQEEAARKEILEEP